MAGSDTTSSAERNIVIIDDDITALDIVSYLFEDRGFKVHRCTDGRSAVDFVKRYKPDLIIADLMMPELNGVQTVKLIRGLGLKDLPIIAFTAVDDSAFHEEALQAGANIVLTKPCPPEKLLKHVRTFLRD